jgi:hypothetical protein
MDDDGDDNSSALLASGTSLLGLSGTGVSAADVPCTPLPHALLGQEELVLLGRLVTGEATDVTRDTVAMPRSLLGILMNGTVLEPASLVTGLALTCLIAHVSMDGDGLVTTLVWFWEVRCVFVRRSFPSSCRRTLHCV